MNFLVCTETCFQFLNSLVDLKVAAAAACLLFQGQGQQRKSQFKFKFSFHHFPRPNELPTNCSTYLQGQTDRQTDSCYCQGTCSSNPENHHRFSELNLHRITFVRLPFFDRAAAASFGVRPTSSIMLAAAAVEWACVII